MNQKQEIHLTIPADHQYLNLVSACLQAIFERYEDLSEKADLLYNLQLGVHEICSNIIEHAYGGLSPGAIEVDFDISQLPGSIHISLSDTGLSFEPESTPTPDLGIPQVHGYGLFLAYELLDFVRYHREEGVNHWILEKNLTQE